MWRRITRLKEENLGLRRKLREPENAKKWGERSREGDGGRWKEKIAQQT